jgi:dihydropteroate synthase
MTRPSTSTDPSGGTSPPLLDCRQTEVGILAETGAADLAGSGRRADVLMLGARRYDVTTRALVMGILNRTPDSFYDRGATFALDALVGRAAQLVADGADVLDVGGVKAGPGPEVGEQEELDRVVPAVAALTERFDVPVSVDTWRASVAGACYAAGAVLGNDISGFADPRYLEVAAAAGASVVATHIRLAPRVPDPEPVYDNVVGAVSAFLVERARRAASVGIPPWRVVLDAGLDLGKTAEQSLALLRASDVLADLGHPLLLSASNKTFLGVVLGLELTERRAASLAAAALGLARGCRLLRVHDVAGTRRVRDAVAAVLEAGAVQ